MVENVSTNLSLGSQMALGCITLGLLATSIIAGDTLGLQMSVPLASFLLCFRCPPERGLLLFHRHEGRSHLPSASPAPGMKSEPASCFLPFCLYWSLFLPLPHKWLPLPSALSRRCCETLGKGFLSPTFLIHKVGENIALWQKLDEPPHEEYRPLRCLMDRT